MQNMEQIYKEYFETVNKYLFCLTHDSDISEELTQETFYRAVKKIHTFKRECKISVWLCQIAKNLWYDEVKRKKKFQDIAELDIETLENIEDIVISKDNKSNLYNRIQKLDSKTKEVVLLRITGDLSFKEIADILNKTENWARTTFYRGKQKLMEVNLDERL